MGRIIPYIMENKTCSKPPTSYCVQLSITNETINQMTIGCIPVMSPEYHGYIMDISWIWNFHPHVFRFPRRIKAGTKTVRTTKVSSRTLVMILETAASEVVVVFKPCESNWI